MVFKALLIQDIIWFYELYILEIELRIYTETKSPFVATAWVG